MCFVVSILFIFEVVKFTLKPGCEISLQNLERGGGGLAWWRGLWCIFVDLDVLASVLTVGWQRPRAY